LSQSDRASRVNTDPYQEIASFYDLEHDQFSDDLALIRQLVEMVGDPVLELGCGTGRVLQSLESLDMRLCGVDSSPVMLDRARQRLSTARNVRLIEADMRQTGLRADHFGIAIVALNSLLHATTSHDQRAVLQECWRVLDPRGLLYIDMPNPHAGAFEFEENRVVHEGHWTLPDGCSVTKQSARSMNWTEQRITTRLWYDVVDQSGTLKRHMTSFDLRFLYPSELLLMLESAGFVEWQTYGSYELDPFTDTSPRFIVTAEKSRSH